MPCEVSGADEAAIVFRKAAELKKQYPSITDIGVGGNEEDGPAESLPDLMPMQRFLASA